MLLIWVKYREVTEMSEGEMYCNTPAFCLKKTLPPVRPISVVVDTGTGTEITDTYPDEVLN